MTKVFIIESERGWGQRVEETIEFPTREAAIAYATEYNQRYNPPLDEVPDWYMYAQVEGDPLEMRR